jgi:hypothetical protein
VPGARAVQSVTVECPRTKTADAASVSADDPIGFTITVSSSGASVSVTFRPVPLHPRNEKTR